MNRPSPSLDMLLSAMVISMFAAGFALMCVAAFLSGLALGKFLVWPVAAQLFGVVA